jgi:putative DNA primase/helicase
MTVQNNSNALLRVVIAAVIHGYSVLPCGPNKRSLVDWASLQTTRASIEQVERWHADLHPASWGVVTGAVSGIVVIDFDGTVGLATAAKYGVQLYVCTPNGGGHQYLQYPGFRVPTLTGSTKAALKEALPGVDIRGDGGYACFIGRTESGAYKRQRPLSKPDPWGGPLVDVLMPIINPPKAQPEPFNGTASGEKRISAEDLLERYLEKEKNGAGRNDTGFDLAVQLRDNGYSEDEAAAVMLQYAAAVKGTNTKGRPEPYTESEVRATLRSVYHRSAREPWASKRTDRTEETPPAQDTADAKDQGHQARSEDKWPQPEPIGGTLPPVKSFEERLLPVSLRPVVLDTAERLQVPVDLPAAAAVVSLGGVVSRRAVVQPKDNDSSWSVTPNLWGALVAISGLLKTPALQAIVRPLIAIETDYRRDHADLMKEYVRAKEKFDLRHKAWQEKFKSATKKGGAEPDRPAGEPEKPILRRLICNDATFEALHQTMADNPAGILAVRDELPGWWAELDKQGREGERAFYLQAWNGDTPFTLDRIGRGTIHAPNCCLSMIGGIQPARLRSYLAEALKDGPANDGLIQRFQVMVWPDTERAWRRINRPANQSAQQQAEKVFRKLVELDADQPARFFFDEDGQELFWQWLEGLEGKVRGDELHPALVSHLSKYRSLMPSLALLFCLADQADQADGEFPRKTGGKFEIPLENVRQAAAMCEYLESHARRVYSSLLTPQMRAAHELAARIKRREIGVNEIFSSREVYRKGWAGLDSPELAERATEVLQDAGWIRPVATEPKPAGGRASTRFNINPKVWR